MGERNSFASADKGFLELVKTGTGVFTPNMSALTINSVPHGLDYTPLALVYGDYDGALYPLPFCTGFAADDTVFVGFNNWFYFVIDESELELIFINPNSLEWGDIPYRYFLYRQVAI